MIAALYLHIPFCVSRCSYCDFATSACDDDVRMDAYVDALSMQLRRAAKAGLLGDVRTIYIGGGTPTHLGARRLNSLVYLISLSMNLENVDEFTVEANPESLDERMVADLFALGVNRFSIGAQSFDDAVLGVYGRVHDASQIEHAVQCIKTRTNSFSLDLICGGPGQSMESWEDSLERACTLGAEHVSVYPLMVEESTPLYVRVEAGECRPADEELQAQMMERASEILESHGLYRYEVASYAKIGRESRHNTAYWTGVEYLGLGAGAASMLSAETCEQVFDAGVFEDDLLSSNVISNTSNVISSEARDLNEPYRIRLSADADDVSFAQSLGKPQVEVETLTAREAALEDLMLGMRRSEGVPRTQVEFLPEAIPIFDDLVCKGLVVEDDGRFKPTERGWLMGNEIFGAIWDLA